MVRRWSVWGWSWRLRRSEQQQATYRLVVCWARGIVRRVLKASFLEMQCQQHSLSFSSSRDHPTSEVERGMEEANATLASTRLGSQGLGCFLRCCTALLRLLAIRDLSNTDRKSRASFLQKAGRVKHLKV